MEEKSQYLLTLTLLSRQGTHAILACFLLEEDFGGILNQTITFNLWSMTCKWRRDNVTGISRGEDLRGGGISEGMRYAVKVSGASICSSYLIMRSSKTQAIVNW